MAKKNDAPAISLFSFQDIITSLTGIMFLVVLLLILFMIDMRPKNQEDAALSQVRTILKEEKENLKKLRQQVLELKERENKMNARISELKKLDLDNLWLKISRIRLENEKLLAALKALNDETLMLRNKRRDAAAATPSALKKVQRLEEEEKKLKKKEKALQEKIRLCHAKTQYIKSAVQFSVDNSTSLSPVLVECSKDGVRILDAATGEKTDLRKPGSSNAEQYVLLMQHIMAKGGKNHYYLLLVKPESFECSRWILNMKDIPKGLELLPDDSKTIFTEEI